jgi:hypothetical protein
MTMLYRAIAALAFCLVPASGRATEAKIDADICAALRLEQIKFRQSGILDDMSKGPEWAKANLPPDRLREVEHYLQLNEQVKFGCRDAKLSPEAEKASEAAARIEINSDADPTAPVASDSPKPGAKSAIKKRTSHRKTKPADRKPQGFDQPKNATSSKVSDEASAPPVIFESASEPASGSQRATEEVPSLPAFGLGPTMVAPHSSP